MAEQKESSVLFSLKELMSLEEDRIKEEEAEKEARTRADAEARSASERTAREHEERRLRDEEERRRQEEQRRREEAARLDAIRHGEIEKARAEAEHRARMEAMASQQQHEQQLAQVSQQSGAKRLKLIVGLVSAALVLLAVGGGILVSNYADEKDRQAAALEAQRKATEQELLSMKRDFDQALKKEQTLRESLASAKDEAERAKIESQLARAKKETEQRSQAVRQATGTSKGASKKPDCECPPGDPLCACL